MTDKTPPDPNRRLSADLEKFWAHHVKLRFADPGLAWRKVFTVPSKGAPTAAQVDAGVKKCLSHPVLQARFARALMQAAENEAYGVAEIVRDWVRIINADPNDLIQYRRVNCRYCNGEGGAYQWRNDVEYLEAVARAIGSKPPKPAPQCNGGFGFKGNGPVNADCLHCDGEGIGEIFLPDTRKATRHPLYRGIKQTANGISVVMADQDAVRKTLGEHLGMFAKDGSGEPVKPAPEPGELKALSPVEAAKRYQEIMG